MTAPVLKIALPTGKIPVRGGFDLAAAARFLTGFAPAGRPEADGEPGALRVAFPVDGAWTPMGAVLRQRAPDTVAVEVHGPAEHAEAVVAQVTRMCSLDVDGTAFPETGARDPVVSLLQELHPGLRPVLFASPYEAACWAVLSHRIWMSQAVRVRRRLTERHGTEVDVGGTRLTSFPAPRELAKLEHLPGLPGHKLQRLRGIAEAAAEGVLDAAALRAMPADAALKQLQLLPGVGRFSAELILIRGAGHPDVFPRAESRLHEIMREAYHLPDAEVGELTEIAEAWAPFRSWASFLFRVEGEARMRESR
jgi:3-methyladenine DNA glycosylase/8-oxoguanine DNA glycosylase